MAQQLITTREYLFPPGPDPGAADRGRRSPLPLDIICSAAQLSGWPHPGKPGHESGGRENLLLPGCGLF